jgi:hypothetical protein
MKEKKTDSEKTIVIDIKLTKGLVVALSCVLVVAGLLAYLTLVGERVAASETETAQAASTGMRQFYLTQDAFFPSEALTACAAGYHMASLWELAAPSNLKYNTALGSAFYGDPDLGQGPPSFPGGLKAWVRTGYEASTSATAGQANCDAWSSDDAGDSGTVAYLPSDWTGVTQTQDVGVWSVDVHSCWQQWWVWCIED